MYTIDTEKSRLDTELVHRFLSSDAYWSIDIPREIVETAIANSFCFGAFDEAPHTAGFRRS